MILKSSSELVIMFVFFFEIIFHFQIIIEESTYFNGEKKRGNEKETKKERNEMKMKMKEEVYLVFEIVKKKY